MKGDTEAIGAEGKTSIDALCFGLDIEFVLRFEVRLGCSEVKQLVASFDRLQCRVYIDRERAASSNGGDTLLAQVIVVDKESWMMSR